MGDHGSFNDIELKPGESQGDAELQDFLQTRQHFRSQWNGIRRLLFCADVHLRNATEYQQFHQELQDCRHNLDRYVQRMKYDLEQLEKEARISNPAQLRKIAERMKKVLAGFELWDATVQELVERSTKIVPVPLRTQKLTEPLDVKALCAYKISGVQISEGDNMKLLDNSDNLNWKVRTNNGEEVELPAVVCLIPPPDEEAVLAAHKLEQNFADSWDTANMMWTKRILAWSTRLMNDMLDRKHLCKTIHGGHKEELENIMKFLDDTFSKRFLGRSEYSNLKKILTNMRNVFDESSAEGKEAEKFTEDVMVVLQRFFDLIMNYDTFAGQFEKVKDKGTTVKKVKVNQVRLAREESLNGDMSGEWDSLESFDSDVAREFAHVLEVSISRELELAEATQITSCTGEIRQTFYITAVVDPNSNTELSIRDAVRKGVIDQRKGNYVLNLRNGKSIPIPEAMSRGYIKVESVKTNKSKEDTKSLGLITLISKRETRPYTIRRVIDPRTDKRLGVMEAINQGIYDAEEGRYCNPSTGDEMTLEGAIDSGALIVDFDPDAEVEEEDIVSKTFLVYSVMDTKDRRRISFNDAVERAIIDRDTGDYLDSKTQETIPATDAVKRGFIKARLIEDPHAIEKFMKGDTMSLDFTRRGSLMY